jgi:hypothetical protein
VVNVVNVVNERNVRNAGEYEELVKPVPH